MTKSALKFAPYGIANFKVLRSDDFAYVDKTQFIAKLEESRTLYPFIVRRVVSGKRFLRKHFRPTTTLPQPKTLSAILPVPISESTKPLLPIRFVSFIWTFPALTPNCLFRESSKKSASGFKIFACVTALKKAWNS